MIEVLLTIAIPAYNRPDWFQRALLSILSTPLAEQKFIEIVVSDDSTIADCRLIFEEQIKVWSGAYQYQSNAPSLGMAGNWNECIRRASGQYILILHDDDYLEPRASLKILDSLRQYSQYSVLLFGVNVVNSQGRILKRQHFKQNHYLDHLGALERVLTNSSFVRFPGIVIRKIGFEKVGYFDETIGGIADVHLWVRLFYEYGVVCSSSVTANYTVHSEALTMGMFNQIVVDQIIDLFDWIELQSWLELNILIECRDNYLHQFILAGTFRHLRRFKFKRAREIFRLFKHYDLSQNIILLRWKLLRFFLQIIIWN